MGEMLNEQRTAAVALITPNLSALNAGWPRTLETDLDLQSLPRTYISRISKVDEAWSKLCDILKRVE